MTAQEAFHKLLTEKSVPMTPDELATIALERGYVSSNARDPVRSIASTVWKCIHQGKYNHPELVFIGRRPIRIGLPSMQENGNSANEAEHKKKTLNIELPEQIADRIQLATQAKIAESQNETVVKLLKTGLSAHAEEIRKKLLQQLNDI